MTERRNEHLSPERDLRSARLYRQVGGLVRSLPHCDLLLTLAVVGLFGLSLVKFVAQSQLLQPLGPRNWFYGFDPLVARLLTGQEVTYLPTPQYGVVSYLLADPFLRVGAGRYEILGLGVLLTQLVAVAVAFGAVGHSYLPRAPRVYLVALAGWLAFVPTGFSLALRSADAWLLALFSIGLVLFAGTPLQRALSAFPLAAAALVRVPAAAVFAVVALRSRRAIVFGVAAVAALLVAGHILYGSAIGMAYPASVLGATTESVRGYSIQQENNSLRGLMYKVAAGFHLAAGGGGVVRPAGEQYLNTAAWVISVALITYVMALALWRRGDQTEERSLLLCLMITTGLLASPATPHEYFIQLLPVYTVLAVYCAHGVPRPWPLPVVAAFVVGTALVGVFVPAPVLGRLIPLEALMLAAGNDPDVYGGATLATYQFLGFPALGLLLTWFVVAYLERAAARAAPPRQPVYGS